MEKNRYEVYNQGEIPFESVDMCVKYLDQASIYAFVYRSREQSCSDTNVSWLVSRLKDLRDAFKVSGADVVEGCQHIDAEKFENALKYADSAESGNYPYEVIDEAIYDLIENCYWEGDMMLAEEFKELIYGLMRIRNVFHVEPGQAVEGSDPTE